MKTVIEMAHAVYGANTKWTDAQLERLEQFAELVRADEYESCAKMVDHILKEGGCTYGDAIRARGETK